MVYDDIDGPAEKWRVGWKLRLVVFVVLPLAIGVWAEPVLLHLLGNADVRSPGFHLIRWWGSGLLPRSVVVAIAAFIVLAVKRVAPSVAVVFAAIAGFLTIAWSFLWLTLALAIGGGSLD